MVLGSPSAGPQTTRSGTGKRASIRRRLAWGITLALGGLAAAGVIVVAQANSDPGWHGTRPISISGILPDLGSQPVIAAAPSGHMVVAWSNPPSEGAWRNIYTVHSTGSGWSDPAVISATVDHSFKPDAIIVEDRIFVTWAEGDPPTAIYEAERLSGGPWEMHDVPLGSYSPGGFTWPRLAASADRLHVVFSDDSDILYTTRPLTTDAWLTATAVYTHAVVGDQLKFPVMDISPDGQTLHLVWQEDIFSPDEDVIMYMRGQVNGDSVAWDPAYNLSSRGQEMIGPDVAVDSSGDVHVAWGEVVGGSEEQYIRYTRYADGSWMTPTVRVDSNHVEVHKQSPYFVAPEIDLWEGNDQVTLCVAWHGFREGDFAEEILLSCSQNGGDSWSSPWNVSRSSDDDWTLSVNPSIAFDVSGRLQVVWQERAGDDLGRDYAIYYAYSLDNQIFLPLVLRNG